ncbi:MAG: metallophosphoesterase [Candidatus Dojkabacteria bacterium]
MKMEYTVKNKWTDEKLKELLLNINKPVINIVEVFRNKGWEEESKEIIECLGSESGFAAEEKKNPYIGSDFSLEELISDDDGDKEMDIFSQFADDEEVDVESMLSTLESEFIEGNKGYISEKKEQKYLVISDTHIPFHRRKALEAIIDKYASKDYTLILLGDILDCHDISSFPKAYSVGLDREVKLLKAYLTEWSEKFDRILIVSGNHEKRMATYLRKRLAAEVVQFMPDDILDKIVTDLKLENVEYCPGDAYSWYVQVDNVMLTHPSTFITSILGTTVKVMEYFQARGTNANVFITAHTHRQGIALHNGNVLVENGCMCLPQDYAMEGKVNYKPQANGYVTFISKNNKVTFNDVRLYNL